MESESKTTADDIYHLCVDCGATIDMILKKAKARINATEPANGAQSTANVKYIRELCEMIIPTCENISFHLYNLRCPAAPRFTRYRFPPTTLMDLETRHGIIAASVLTSLKFQLQSLHGYIASYLHKFRAFVVVYLGGHDYFKGCYDALKLMWERFERFWEVVSCSYRVLDQRIRARRRGSRQWVRDWSTIYKENLHNAQSRHLLRYEDSNECMDLVLGVTEAMFPDPDETSRVGASNALRTWVTERCHNLQMSDGTKSGLEGKTILDLLSNVERLDFRMIGWVESEPDGLTKYKMEDLSLTGWRPGYREDATSLFSALSQLKPTPPISRRIKIGYRLAHAVLSLQYWYHERKGKDLGMPKFVVPKEANKRPKLAVPYLSYLMRVDLGENPTRPGGSTLCETPYYLKEKHEFDMCSDLYGLGVSLLEVGMWHPGKVCVECGAHSYDGVNQGERGPYFFQKSLASDKYLETIRGPLIAQMGPMYAAVVMWCLSRAVIKRDLKPVRNRYAYMDGVIGRDPLAGPISTLSPKTSLVEFIENVLIPLSSISM